MRRLSRRALLLGTAGLGGATLLSGCAAATPAAAPGPARSTKIWQVGFLLTNPLTDPVAVEHLAEFRAGLRELGYAEGQNLVLELRSAEGKPERFAALAEELVAMRLDLILSATPWGVQRLKEATSSVPIVFVGVNPEVAGITDHARPGGNLTGIGEVAEAALNAKRVQLLKEAVPTAARIVVVRNPSGGVGLVEAQEAARQLAVHLQLVDVRSVDDFDAALTAAVEGRADALMVVARVLALPRAAWIAEFTLRGKLPSMHQGREFVEAGGLMSYASDSKASWRRATTYVDRILKGAYPGDLPVEAHPAAYELVVNLCTAERLGIAIPPSVLAQAEVIQCTSR